MSAPTSEQYIPTQFRVSDFLNWQRQGTLDLNPPFQRRSVWKPGARSFLVDTVVRGLPVPLVFLQERLDLVTGSTIRAVVDGQQRLRTLLGYIDPTCLPDYSTTDFFTVSKTHNKELAGRGFEELSEEHRARILTYRFSVQILPANLGERAILEIFARLNSTGQRLTPQELRNAAYFGECKSLMYRLAFEYTDDWLAWRVFNSDQMSRMAEVELTSDLCYNMIHGLSGKSQPRLDRMYAEFDSAMPFSVELGRRFHKVMEELRERVGPTIAGTVYQTEVHFFTLFVLTYDLLYGLGSELQKRQEPRPLPSNFRVAVLEASRRFREFEVPPAVLDAVTRASADAGRRRTRLQYMHQILRGVEHVRKVERAV